MFELAKERYESIRDYLGEPDSPLAKYKPIVYLQGSARLGLTVRPHNENEFDVDVICQLVVPDGTTQGEFIDLVYDRLKTRGCYTLKKMNRCVRVEYANQFHIDITPAIPDEDAAPENILVTDKGSGRWKSSNPKDYSQWFKAIADLEPKISYATHELMAKSAGEPLPPPKAVRPLLNRIIQLLKRHRDIMFDGRKEMPISAIITTLATHAYYAQVGKIWDSQIEFLLAVVEDMPNHFGLMGRRRTVLNPANRKENYADKWPEHPEREEAFDKWHDSASGHFRRLADRKMGKNNFYRELSVTYGENATKKAMNQASEDRRIASEMREVGVSKVTGMIVPAVASSPYMTTSKTLPVWPHTNFGR